MAPNPFRSRRRAAGSRRGPAPRTTPITTPIASDPALRRARSAGAATDELPRPGPATV
ncbi:hypothetical protein GTW08_16905, partial [Pseudonocardia sp. SID8383]|nr:hypothetical protein [Pseudonocardia sp. SID8383]